MREGAPNKADLVAAARAAAQRRPQRGVAVGEGPRGFDSHPDYRDSLRMKQVGALVGLSTPFFRLHEGHAQAVTRIAGREVTNFASYDYCGLNADPRVAAAAKAAIDLYGVSPSGSRLVAGCRPVHDALEAALARHYEAEAALCFVSGHSTNVSTIAQVMGEGDLILHDALCHNSILVGVKLSGAARRAFPHNDMATLEALLAENRGLYRNALIVTEGLFSMDGDMPPLAELVALKRRFGCWLMVDEAHALGCVGARGAGSFEAAGVPPGDVDIWMGTLSKTLAATGGYIAGSAALIELLRDHAAGFVYSVALAPALAAAATQALALLGAEPERVARLQANAALFLDAARAAGLQTGAAGPFGIVPVLVGDSLLAAKLSERLLARGVNVMPVMFPAVPMQGARLRFFLSALHDETQVRAAVAATAEELEGLRRDGFGSAIPPALLGM
ncbi:8-amino-7-oxononanoate synthase [Tabrizicola sp. TH137]|uniref:aminotransferase class I/II-fold pyridoxal phosphate-dependent enzyme n=1 Tax=Tabrizicola sp. TH137 TaxID=2067452 RepID=UPI000C7C8E79|nr:aminotransferase class I/II-fold pyridoxal phosphate-dependent enzyme [Tabrizicola sp. TH137]PLL10801.1 8-amino-7-oxononanoate synthase [Tabrizicola sp. TH137]